MDEWPATTNVTWYLNGEFASGDGVSSCTCPGTGGLSLTAPSEEVEKSYIYDPSNPVPSHGGI